MPRDGSGVYSLPAGYLAVNGDIIQPSQHNPPLEDIANALTNSLPRNGAAAMTGNLNMGSNRITSLANGTQPTDAATLQQAGAIGFFVESVQTGNYTILVGDAGKAIIGNSATTITFSLPAAASALGLAFTIRNINTGAVVLDPNGAELIEGQATIGLRNGEAAFLWSTGTAWRLFMDLPLSAPSNLMSRTKCPPITRNNPANPTRDIDILVGGPFLSRAGRVLPANTSIFTKRSDQIWAQGSGNGGMDTGAKAAGDTLFVHQIFKISEPNLVDFLLSKSEFSPTLPAGWDDFGIVFAHKLDGAANYIAGVQDGNDWIYSVPINDVTTGALGTAAILRETTVPRAARGVNVYLRSRFSQAGAGQGLISSPSEADNAPTITNCTHNWAAGQTFVASLTVKVDGQARIRLRSAIAATTADSTTVGYSYSRALDT